MPTDSWGMAGEGFHGGNSGCECERRERRPQYINRSSYLIPKEWEITDTEKSEWETKLENMGALGTVLFLGVLVVGWCLFVALVLFAGHHFIEGTKVVLGFVWSFLWENILSLFPWDIFVLYIGMVWPYIRIAGVVLIWIAIAWWILGAMLAGRSIRQEILESKAGGILPGT